MSARYALIRDGEVVDRREFADAPPDRSSLAAGKPYWLPIETVDPEFDPVAQVRSGPTVTIEDVRVVEEYAVRDKTSDEVGAMRDVVNDRIEAQFQARATAPITFAIGGQSYDWDADAEAITNISGVVLLIAVGASIPDPRPWTPMGSLTPQDVTHAQLVGLGAAIASRKDALFVIKKTKKAAVAALSEPQAIADYDVSAGWE